MTDKQIIIDKLKNDIDCKENIINHLADSNIELQKQLKAKEQECEELKEILKDKTDEYNKLAVNYDAYVSMANKQLDQLKAELEQEKALKETYLACYKAKHEDIEVELFKLKAENTKLKEELNKKQTNYYDDLDSLGSHGLSDW